MLKLNSLLISIFVGTLTLYGGYNYVGADEPEPASVVTPELNARGSVDPNATEEATTEEDTLEREMRESTRLTESPEYKAQQEAEVDEFVEQMRKSKRLRESPEYKAQEEAEMKARIQKLKEEAEKQEKNHQQSYKGPFGSIFDLFKSHPILGILVVIVAVIYLNIRDYYKKLKNRPW